MTEDALRALLVELAGSLFQRGYSVGSAGNISVKLEDGYLITPTNSCLGRLVPGRLSRLDAAFVHVGGDAPSKEVFMHRAFYSARPGVGAVAHLHSTMATAMACLDEPMPLLTPYFVMRIGGHLPLVPYYRPGDRRWNLQLPPLQRAHLRCYLQITAPSYRAEVCSTRFMPPRNWKRRRSSRCCCGARRRVR